MEPESAHSLELPGVRVSVWGGWGFFSFLVAKLGRRTGDSSRRCNYDSLTGEVYGRIGSII